MSNELVKELRTVNVRMTPNTATDLVRKAAARIEALEAENARKDDALRRVEWALAKQSLTDKGRVQDALSVARRAREGGNADG